MAATATAATQPRGGLSRSRMSAAVVLTDVMIMATPVEGVEGALGIFVPDTAGQHGNR